MRIYHFFMLFMLLAAILLTGDLDGGKYHPNPMPYGGFCLFLGLLTERYIADIWNKRQ